MKKAIIKHPNDNVATVLENIDVNEKVQILSEKTEVLDVITAIDPIPFGNKIAICNIEADVEIIKCGYSIGKSSKQIEKGKLVHVHNVRSERINFPDVIIDEIIRQMGLKEKGITVG
ncbi:UxaA family hydrolase [Tepidibacter aestuarii]|uniref:UxaA family hydrolase n=1 Tax=Tepidibacter aestuarii TaxID=2925782 RepID=UPI0020BD8AE1|nr:UxaA family hydrolase [Tepidibacter aestuarii]CAH2211952.1 Carbohydrate kinase [Tepidibacter aestuarii]